MRAMKVLHLFSNHKWTGPAEPAASLCKSLQSQGVDTAFACSTVGPKWYNTVLINSRELGLDPLQRFKLPKHENPVVTFSDARKIAAYLQDTPYDLIHCHMNNDHAIAVHAARKSGTPIIRTSYEGLGLQHLQRRVGYRLKRTAFLIEPSQCALEYDADHHGYPREQMRVVPGAVDTARFDPTRVSTNAREELGIPEDAFVVGLIARMQRHRKFEDFFAAIRALVDHDPRVHAVIVGRGTYQDTVGRAAVEALNLQEHVHFSGYVSEDDYVKTINSFDVKVYMVPGSDGTCRAVREAMAMGKPAIVSTAGMLPEIVEDGVDGLVFDATPEDLERKLRRVLDNPEETRSMGKQALKKARAVYSLEAQAKAVLKIYNDVLS